MNETNVETKGTELIFSRVFDAPRELVFETYSNCGHLKNWWGPRDWPISYCEMDFQVGGKWHYCMSGPNDGDESWGISLFKEINKPERIVYIDSFSDKDGKINEEMPSFHITVTFDSIGDKTEITTLSRVDKKEDLEELIEMGMIEGFTETWDRLEEYLESIQ